MGCTSTKDVSTTDQHLPRVTSSSRDTPAREPPSTRDPPSSCDPPSALDPPPTHRQPSDADKNCCPICLNSLIQPKTLHCQHVLCSRCLQRYINNLNNTAKLRGFPCPICRKLTIMPNSDTPRQTWVAQLQDSENEVTADLNGIAVPNSSRNKPGIQSTVIKATLKGDNFEPMIVDIVVVHFDGIDVVVVADFNNKSLKSMYTRRGRECSSFQTLESNPFCMTLVSDRTVALTLPWSDKIGLAEINPDVRVVNTIQTSKAYYGITGIDEDFLAVSTTWQTPASVDIIDHNGKIIKSVDTDGYGDNLFSDPWYLATTPSGDVLVSDCQEQLLLCTDQSGNTKWRYKPSGDRMLKTPAGVACDVAGNIYLVDSDKHYVIKLDEHGRFLDLVASRDDGVERPRCVTVTNAGALYVTLESGDIRVISLALEG